MNTQKLTQKTIQALQNAQIYAQNNGNQMIEPAHLSLALVSDSDGLVTSVVTKVGGNISSIKKN